MSSLDYIGFHCRYGRCDNQYLNMADLQNHIERIHLSNSTGATNINSQARHILQARRTRSLQPINPNVILPRPIVQQYEEGAVRLGGGITVRACGSMTDNEKAIRFMHLLRIPNCEFCPKGCRMAPCLWEDHPERGVECMPDSPADPSRDNHSKRKELYNAAWATLDNIGYFGLKEYLAAEKARIDALPTAQEKQKARASRRKPLPKCTEDAVRFYFPNPPDMPYMNFKYY